jgi:LacI family transcriptional regulator
MGTTTNGVPTGGEPAAKGSRGIIEVAKAAGVSTATVSRVLNGLPGVRAETVAQVRAAVEQLKYTRLRSRSSRKRASPRNVKLRTGSIAVLTLGPHGQVWVDRPVMASVLGGIQRGANAHDVRLLLGEMYDVTKPSSLLVDRQLDGAIVFVSSWMPIAAYGAAFRAIQQYVPVVWAMGMELGISGVDHVAPDNVGIGFLAFSHLHGLGCRRPAFLTGDPGWPLMRLRGQSFLNSAFDAGLRPTVYAVADDPRAAEPYGPRAVLADNLADLVEQLARANPRPDGLFIGNDHTTSSVYPLLARHGIRVGQDLHVISCDAEEARLSGLHPRPPSIDIGGDEIGYRSVNRLLNRIERPNGPPLIIQVAPRLQLPSI